MCVCVGGSASSLSAAGSVWLVCSVPSMCELEGGGESEVRRGKASGWGGGMSHKAADTLCKARRDYAPSLRINKIGGSLSACRSPLPPHKHTHTPPKLTFISVEGNSIFKRVSEWMDGRSGGCVTL